MNNIEKQERLKLDEERVETAKKRIAKCLNLLEASTQELRWACETQHWNDEVVFQMEEAATKLGYALGTLTNWDDALEDPV